MVRMLKSYLRKTSYIAAFSAFFFMSSGTKTYAASAGGSSKCYSNIPSWLAKLGGLFEEPVQWIMYGSAVTTAVFLLIGFLMLRGARGRQDKVDQAYNFFKYFAAGSFGIFSVMGIGDWFLGKIC
ncbi:hypothetical protein [Bacillus sp. FSL K6-6540]|uniref:hypothetical protein n=1 Tax=Bacillus sp. FSL K6-6540 TaxID=2921512 RepID=UPI0030FA86DC